MNYIPCETKNNLEKTAENADKYFLNKKYVYIQHSSKV